jgi:SAM-dependent methyltransferase
VSSRARSIGDAWNREYEGGRYQGEPPLAFVDDIVRASTEAGLTHRRGLYIGCGNGRNYSPLVEWGLDLVGLDVSSAAIAQLADRMPHRRSRLLVGDLAALRPSASFAVIVAIQVFQHGRRRETHDHIRSAQRVVARGGLLCVRVNAAGTDVVLRHDLVERSGDGGFTVRYLEGPKGGLDVHFFGERELGRLFASGWEPLLPLRPQVTSRPDPEQGQWTQWEGIWRRTPEP